MPAVRYPAPLLIAVAVALLLSVVAYGRTGAGPDGSNAIAVHSLGITGAGVNIGLLSATNTRVTHEAFYEKDTSGLPTGSSHAFWYDATSDGDGYYLGANGHDTWVAGIAVGRGGSTNPGDIGVAPGADIYSERVVTSAGSVSTQYIQNALDDLRSHSCRVVYTGIAIPETSVTPDGTSKWALMYDYYADTYNMVFACPAGNIANNDPNITVFGDAYNAITTGGLAFVETGVWRKVGYLSCIGPTVDGRQKPEVTAPSQGQTMPDNTSDTAWLTWPTSGGETSLSTPHSAGVAALLLELADTTTDTADNQNEVIRAVIVNSTFPNIRNNSNQSTTGQTFNVARGYGRVDALDAYQTLASPKVSPSGHTTAARGWAYDSVKNATDIYYVAGTTNQRLRVTMAWNRKVSFNGFTYTGQALVNLTMQVLDPDGVIVFQETTAKDNLRKCDILLPKTGEYRIRVTNGTNTTADYGLAFELVPFIPGDFDVDYIVDYSDLAVLASQWLLDGTGLVSDLASPAGHIDFADFAAMAAHWMATNNAYYAGY